MTSTLYAVHNSKPIAEVNCPLVILQRKTSDEHETYEGRLAIYEDREQAEKQMEMYDDHHIQIAEIEVTDYNVSDDQ